LPHFGKFRKILSPIRFFCADHSGRPLDEKRGRPMLSRPDTSVGPIIADLGKRATILGILIYYSDEVIKR
jgi:hypothetical protein